MGRRGLNAWLTVAVAIGALSSICAPAHGAALLHWYDQLKLNGKLFHWTMLENGHEVHYFDLNGDGTPDRKDVRTPAGHESYTSPRSDGEYGEVSRFVQGGGYFARTFERRHNGSWSVWRSYSMRAEKGNLVRVLLVEFDERGVRRELQNYLVPRKIQEFAGNDSGICYLRYRQGQLDLNVVNDQDALTKAVSTSLSERLQLTGCDNAFGPFIEKSVLKGIACMAKQGGEAAVHAAVMVAALRDIEEQDKMIGIGCVENLPGAHAETLLPCNGNWPTDYEVEGEGGKPVKVPFMTMGCGTPGDKTNESNASTAFHEFMHLVGYGHGDQKGESADVVYGCQSCCFPEGVADKDGVSNGVARADRVAMNRGGGCEICAGYDGFGKPDSKYLENYIDVTLGQGYNPLGQPMLLGLLDSHPELMTGKASRKLVKFFAASKGAYPYNVPCAIAKSLVQHSPSADEGLEYNEVSAYVKLAGRLSECK